LAPVMRELWSCAWLFTLPFARGQELFGGSCDPRPEILPNLFQHRVRLRWDSWATSRLATTVAAILLREQLGLEVELVSGSGQGNAEIYELVATGALHAAFEVWPLGKEASFANFASFDVGSGRGALAFNTSILGRSGIFESCSRDPRDGSRRCDTNLFDAMLLDEVLASAQGQAHFSWPDVNSTTTIRNACQSGVFDCDASGMWTPSHCANSNCTAQILHISPDYDQGLIEGIVNNLSMPVKVAYLGMEHHNNAWWLARRKRRGALFYYYTPSIPPHGVPVDDFVRAWVKPEDDLQTTSLQKLAWNGLDSNSGYDVSAFVKSFALGNAEYAELATNYLNLRDTHAAACTWIKKNRATWETWIDFPARRATPFKFWRMCVTGAKGTRTPCSQGCAVLVFLQFGLVVLLVIFYIVSKLVPKKKQPTTEDLQPLIAQVLAVAQKEKQASEDTTEGSPKDAVERLERELDVRIDPTGYANRLAFVHAYRSPPVSIQSVRTFSNFCKRNVDTTMERPPDYPPFRWDGGTRPRTLYMYFFCSGELVHILSLCLFLALLSGGVATILWIVIQYETYQADDQAFIEGRLATGVSTFARLERVSAAFNNVTSSFKFFPSFMILGYVGYTMSRWRGFISMSYSIQGRIHDVSLMIGGAIIDASKRESREFAFKVYRYLTLAHLLVYKAKHPWLEALSMDDLVTLGLLTADEARCLAPAKNKMRDTSLAWLSREIQIALRQGLIHSSCTVTCLDQLARLRGKMAAFHDMFTMNQPNLFASLMKIVVDMLVLLFVSGSPFTMFVYETGCFQVYVVFFTVFLSLPWISCMEIIKIIINPFNGRLDFLNVDSVMGSTEQVAFHNLRVGFDFPVEDSEAQ